jgi:hypothetical protein
MVGMQHKRAYRYRFYPTPEQAAVLARTFGCARYVYNWALRLRTDAYAERHERLDYDDTCAALTVLKQQPENAWLTEVARRWRACRCNRRCAISSAPSATASKGGPSIRPSRRSVGGRPRCMPTDATSACSASQQAVSFPFLGSERLTPDPLPGRAGLLSLVASRGRTPERGKGSYGATLQWPVPRHHISGCRLSLRVIGCRLASSATIYNTPSQSGIIAPTARSIPYHTHRRRSGRRTLVGSMHFQANSALLIAKCTLSRVTPGSALSCPAVLGFVLQRPGLSAKTHEELACDACGEAVRPRRAMSDSARPAEAGILRQ